jgi:hypothetical protein
VNDTFIELSYAYAKATTKNLTCKQNRSNIGEAEVLVDEPIAPVDDFHCRTTNLTTLLCFFKKPTSIMHPIKYKLKYSINGGTVRKMSLNRLNQFTYRFSIFRLD